MSIQLDDYLITMAQHIDRIHEYNQNHEFERELGTNGFLNPDHPYIEVEYDDQIIGIDLYINPIIKCIWTKGIKTSACCQGDEQNDAYISFPSLCDILKFCEEFSYFKENCKFDILNIHLSYQGCKPLDNLTYDILKEHEPVYDDLYSVRFNQEILNIFQ